MTEAQPMKMAAAEALYDTEKPAPFSIFTIGTLDGGDESSSRSSIPDLLSFLATGDFDGTVAGHQRPAGRSTSSEVRRRGDYTPSLAGHLLDASG